MTIDKAINENDLIKAKMKADFIRRYEKAKEKGFKGDLEDFIRRIQHMGLAKGGPVKPNGVTTLTSDDWDIWLQQNDPNYMTLEEEEKLSKRKVPNKLVAYKFGATSQKEEDLIGRHVDDWMNEISRGELDPSTTFMQYINMILGRDSVSRGGIISVI